MESNKLWLSRNPGCEPESDCLIISWVKWSVTGGNLGSSWAPSLDVRSLKKKKRFRFVFRKKENYILGFNSAYQVFIAWSKSCRKYCACLQIVCLSVKWTCSISLSYGQISQAHMMNNRPNYSLEVHAGTDLEEPTRVIVPLKLQDFPNLHELALVEAKIYI
jgi:hypothetical protein